MRTLTESPRTPVPQEVSATTDEAESHEALPAKLIAIREEAEHAAAEVAEAEAILAATRARVKALRLRERLVRLEAGETTETDDDIDESDVDEAAATRWRPRLIAVLRGLLFALTVSATAAGGYVLWQHHQVQRIHQRELEYVDAARIGVLALTSLDVSHAQDGVNNVLAHATGDFKREFQARAEDFAKVVVDSKVVTEGKIHSAAVQSMTADSAVVLVAATSQVTNNAGAEKAPRAWRLKVTMKREGDQIKMANVEFVQ